MHKRGRSSGVSLALLSFLPNLLNALPCSASWVTESQRDLARIFPQGTVTESRHREAYPSPHLMYHRDGFPPFCLAFRIISRFLPLKNVQFIFSCFSHTLNVSSEKPLECSKGIRQWEFRGRQQRTSWSHIHGESRGPSWSQPKTITSSRV